MNAQEELNAAGITNVCYVSADGYAINGEMSEEQRAIAHEILERHMLASISFISL
jgi:hypothetical protein